MHFLHPAGGVSLCCIKKPLNGELLFTILSSLAQFERDVIAARTREGLTAARARGHSGGRPKVDQHNVRQAVNKNILQRQREGIDIAKAKGVYKRRKPIDHSAFDQVVTRWQHGEITAKAAMKQLGMSKATFYRRVKPPAY